LPAKQAKDLLQWQPVCAVTVLSEVALKKTLDTFDSINNFEFARESCKRL